MKKILIFIAGALFICCDYATESLKVKPDVEITYLDPIGWYTWETDTTWAAIIREVHFVPKSSIDCYLDKMIFEYYDEDNNLFFGPDEISMYMKIEGLVDTVDVDTFVVENISLPLSPIRNNLSNGESARALLRFIFIDEYYGSLYDTATVWFGIYMLPTAKK